MKRIVKLIALVLLIGLVFFDIKAESNICEICGHQCSKLCEYDEDGLCIHECRNDPLPIDEGWPKV